MTSLLWDDKTEFWNRKKCRKLLSFMNS